MESEDKRRIRDMEETIRMKNKQIHQLLEDVEEVNFIFNNHIFNIHKSNFIMFIRN